jgi:TRAP-type C4-dicarboxylate transport system permease large subunit
VLGCFIDGVTIKLLLVPILLPLVDAYGIDRVHFGIVLQMSLHPRPRDASAGIGLFVVARISGAPLEDIVRSTLPYFIPLLIVLCLLLMVPGITLWLPNLVMGPG